MAEILSPDELAALLSPVDASSARAPSPFDQVRRFERRRRVLPGVLDVDGGPRAVVVEDLSVGGARCHLDGGVVSLGPGRLRMPLDPPGHLADLQVEVRWCEELPRGVVEVGLAFQALSPRDAWALMRYLEAGQALRVLRIGAAEGDPLAGDAGAPLDVTRVDETADAAAHLRGDTIDVVLLDVDAPPAEVVDAVRRLRAVAPEVPIVVRWAGEVAALDVEALRAGASDCVRRADEPTAVVTALAGASARGAGGPPPRVLADLATALADDD
ncbi:MAG: PilZ domain-containing protein [Myxococcales bacterium]|nr:PilZ domain-containing protein [Myxococcales bacterium]